MVSGIREQLPICYDAPSIAAAALDAGGRIAPIRVTTSHRGSAMDLGLIGMMAVDTGAIVPMGGGSNPVI